jgi:soluble lytic murein transglycosylase-like protein
VPWRVLLRRLDAAPRHRQRPTQALSPEERQLLGNPRQQKLVTNWLAKRYRVASDAADMLVSAAYLTARDIKLDPLLILSVIAIESRFNPSPKARWARRD